MKQLIDFIPLVIFFLFYKQYDIYVASQSLLITTPISLLVTYFIYKKWKEWQKLPAQL